MIRDKDKPMVARILANLSVVCVALAGLSMVGLDVFLASTQWVLVAVAFGVYAVFLLLEAEFRLKRVQ